MSDGAQQAAVSAEPVAATAEAQPESQAAEGVAPSSSTAVERGPQGAAAGGQNQDRVNEAKAEAATVDDGASANAAGASFTAEESSAAAVTASASDANVDAKAADVGNSSGARRPTSAKGLKGDTSSSSWQMPRRPHTARISRRGVPTPGPGSYDPPANPRLSTFPKYSFGGSKRRPMSGGGGGRSLPIEAVKAGEPGPGATDPKPDTVRHKSPKWTLYPSERPPANLPSTACSPKVGPGSYNPAKETTNAPKYTIPGKWSEAVRANGLRWQCVGTEKPYKGVELEHASLGAALALRHSDRSVALLREVHAEPPSQLVDVAGMLQEKPLVMEEQPPFALAAVSPTKVRHVAFSEPEWRQFQIASHQLYTNHYVKVQCTDPNKPEGSKLAKGRPTFAYFSPSGPLKPKEGVESGSLFTTGAFLNPEATLEDWKRANPTIKMPSESAKQRLAIKSGLSMAQVTNFFKGKKGGGPGAGLSKSLPAGAIAGDITAIDGGEAGGGGTAVAVATTGADGFKENLDGAVNIDWKALSEKLPSGKDDDSKARRKALWKRADPNGNGYLSLAEVDLMVRDSVGTMMFSAKPAIAAAFHAARKSGGGKQEGRAGDYVEYKEFRTLFVMLRQYYELYAMFNRLDTSDDRRIDSSEFKSGADMVKGWGVELKDDEIEAEFAKIDVDGGGKILFDEFARWALEKALDLPEDDQEAGEGQEAALQKSEGYIAERNAKYGTGGPISLSGWGSQREPPPTLCYHDDKALAPVQTMARWEKRAVGGNKPSPVFRTPLPKEINMLGGVPMRTLKVGSKFLPNIPPSATGDPIAGMPYALGQLLQKAAAEAKEAEQQLGKQKQYITVKGGWSKKHGWMRDQKIDVRLYGSESLEPPPPAKHEAIEGPKAVEGAAAADATGGDSAAAVPAAAGGGNKKSAKVAPA